MSLKCLMSSRQAAYKRRVVYFYKIWHQQSLSLLLKAFQGDSIDAADAGVLLCRVRPARGHFGT